MMHVVVQIVYLLILYVKIFFLKLIGIVVYNKKMIVVHYVIMQIHITELKIQVEIFNVV